MHTNIVISQLSRERDASGRLCLRHHMSIDQAILTWLDEKRTDSKRTADAYETTLKDFRGTLQRASLDLDSEPAIVAPLAQGWARQSLRQRKRVQRKRVTPSTFNQRRSIVSSFCKCHLTYEVVPYNPLERVKQQKPGKKDSLIWVSFTGRNRGQATGPHTLANIYERYLGTSKAHTLQHTLAVTMHNKHAKTTDISKALGPSDIKITSDYLEEHLSFENPLAVELEKGMRID